MSELTNVFARNMRDLTTPTSTGVNPNTFDKAKIPIGNAPKGFESTEALTVKQLKELTASGRKEELDVVTLKISTEETRAKGVEATLIKDKANKATTILGYGITDAYTQDQIDSKVNNLESKKANKIYVDTAFSNLSTSANKYYPTLAAANADITNIALNQSVTIGEVANSGLWYKTTAGATNLTKSPYDPVGVAAADAIEKANNAKSEAISTSATDATAKASTAESNARLTSENKDTRLLNSLHVILNAISQFRDDYDTDLIALNNNVSENKNLQTLSSAANANNLQKVSLGLSVLNYALFQASEDIKTNSVKLEMSSAVTQSNVDIIQKIDVGMHQLTASVADVLDYVNDRVDGYNLEEVKLMSLLSNQEKTVELSKLDGFDPEKSGSNAKIESENVVILSSPDELIRIDVETNQALPTAKGPVINTINTISVAGQILDCFGTLEVQGSSSANFPKKNWTLGFFNNESREDVIKVKLGHLMPHDELVFKANFVDNTHCRNIAVNRIWDQMQMSRSGWPKREPDFVNTKNGVGLSAQPTGATGHVDGFPAVMYINNQFYGLGCLNIGKKRDNYNLKKDDPKHIQLDPEGSVNLYSLPATPYEPANSGLTTAAFDVRRPATWQEQSQAYYDRLSAFLKMSKSGMETAGIDNYIDRKSMIDYLILCQVCELWDHLHKNTLYTTWDGNIWHFLPYDVDTVFGLHFTGVYYNSDGVTELHPANRLIVPSTAANSSWGTLAKFRLIYGAEIDARYADLRRKNTISVDNILQICENLTRKFPTALFEAENQRWNLVENGTIYQTIQQTGSLKQIHDWLSIRLPLCDSYFNYSA